MKAAVRKERKLKIKTEKSKKGMKTMKKYVCEPCGYVYDPEIGDPDNGIAPGQAFAYLPENCV